MANIQKNDLKELNKIIEKIRKAERSDVDKKINEIVFAIIEERKHKKISQSELAAITGMQQTTISRIETLSSVPTLPVLIKMLNALDMKLEIKAN